MLVVVLVQMVTLVVVMLGGADGAGDDCGGFANAGDGVDGDDDGDGGDDCEDGDGDTETMMTKMIMMVRN